MNRFSAPLLQFKRLTDDVFQYDFAFSEPVDFKAGQFFLLDVSDATFKGTRAYSIASAPSNKGFFSICLKILPDGKASNLLKNMKVGEEAHFQAPFGHFVIQDSPKEIVMIATGTGLAPFMSMLLDLFEKKDPRNVTLLFGVRYEQDLFYVDLLREWEKKESHFKAMITVSRPSEGWTGLNGRVTQHLDIVDPLQSQVYICGNGDMVKEVKTALEAKGVPKTDIHWEQFTPFL